MKISLFFAFFTLVFVLDFHSNGAVPLDDGCYDLGDLVCAPAKRCADEPCDQPLNASEVAAAGYNYSDINFNGVIDVSRDADCPADARAHEAISRVQSCRQVDGGQFGGQGLSKSGACWRVSKCSGTCEKTNAYTSGFEFVTSDGTRYPFKINIFQCQGLSEPTDEGTINVDYFECSVAECMPPPSSGDGGSGNGGSGSGGF